MPTRVQLRRHKRFCHPPPNFSTKALFPYSPWIIGGRINGFASRHHLFYTFSGAVIFEVHVFAGESFICLICRVKYNWDASTCMRETDFSSLSSCTKYYCIKTKSCLEDQKISTCWEHMQNNGKSHWEIVLIFLLLIIILNICWVCPS